MAKVIDRWGSRADCQGASPNQLLSFLTVRLGQATPCASVLHGDITVPFYSVGKTKVRFQAFCVCPW